MVIHRRDVTLFRRRNSLVFNALKVEFRKRMRLYTHGIAWQVNHAEMRQMRQQFQVVGV
jgi:hypothetical protein